jgi:hypothetical protein
MISRHHKTAFNAYQLNAQFTKTRETSLKNFTLITKVAKVNYVLYVPRMTNLCPEWGTNLIVDNHNCAGVQNKPTPKLKTGHEIRKNFWFSLQIYFKVLLC